MCSSYTTDTPELYAEDLVTLQTVMEKLEELAKIDNLFSVEVRVRSDDISVWTVVGYGESGDACILRFESD